MGETQAYKHTYQKRNFYVGDIRIEIKDVVGASDDQLREHLNLHLQALRTKLEQLILEDQMQYRVGAK